MKLENASSTGHRHFPVHHIFVKFVFRSFISHHRSTNKFLTQRERKRKGIFSVLHRIPKHICFRLVASIHRWTKDEEKKPIFYQNKIIIISRFDWVPCRITAPEWKKLSKSEHNLFDFYHFCCLTRFFSFLFQALPISMLFSIYIGAQTSRTFSLHIFFVFVICAARLRNSSSVFARNMQSSDKSRTHFIWHSNANARQKRSSANGDFHSQQRAMFCLATIQPFFSHHFHYSFCALDVETHHLNYHYCSTDLFIDSTVHLEISYLTQITSFVRFSVSFVFSAANSDECVTDCNESNGVLAVQYQ